MAKRALHTRYGNAKIPPENDQEDLKIVQGAMAEVRDGTMPVVPFDVVADLFKRSRRGR
jgi:DNA-directed RNA polymerase subunit K/omega